ncbi:MAG: leucine-rich repeat domain-containing protein [Bacteroidaceae bacterium]|nr:leucine-rich repeat domain-containing protein [Bacteroidaceae bacterium]
MRKTFCCLLLAMPMLCVICACMGKTKPEVIINDDGTTSDGSPYLSIDDENFYLDAVKYSVEDGHLLVTGYDTAHIKGQARIASGISYRGTAYPVCRIGRKAFANCNNLTAVTIPASVTSVGEWAFQNCRNLASATISKGVQRLESGVFYGCTSLASVTIPTSVTAIEDWVFWNCCALTSVDIPSGVTTINRAAFQECTGLTAITIPPSVTTICESAFWGCSSLKSIDIPASVTTIKHLAFAHCPGLTNVNCRIKQLSEATIDDTMLRGDSLNFITLRVPSSAIEEYRKSEPWKRVSRIEGL